MELLSGLFTWDNDSTCDNIMCAVHVLLNHEWDFCLVWVLKILSSNSVQFECFDMMQPVISDTRSSHPLVFRQSGSESKNKWTKKVGDLWFS